MNIDASQSVRIDVKAFAAHMTDRVGTAVTKAVAKTGYIRGLAVVLVCEDPASQVFARRTQGHFDCWNAIPRRWSAVGRFRAIVSESDFRPVC